VSPVPADSEVKSVAPIQRRSTTLGEFREIRESKAKTGIAADGHPAGSRGADGVERSGHERTVNGCATASQKKRIVFSTGIAWFGDILIYREGGARRDRAPFGFWQSGGLRQAVASGSRSAQADPAGLADSGKIVASGGRRVTCDR